MAQQGFFLVKVSIDNVIFKSLKFKVQSQSDCERLLYLCKTRNKYVKNASFLFSLPNGSVHIWRFNNSWYKATGTLIPILKDVRGSMFTL